MVKKKSFKLEINQKGTELKNASIKIDGKEMNYSINKLVLTMDAEKGIPELHITAIPDDIAIIVDIPNCAKINNFKWMFLEQEKGAKHKK